MKIKDGLQNILQRSQYEQVLFKNNKANFIFATITVILTAVDAIIMAFILKVFFDVAANGSTKDFITLMIACLIYVIYDTLLGLLRKKFKNKFFYVSLTNLKNQVFEDMIHQNINLFNSTETSKFLSGFSNDITIIETDYLENTLVLIEKAVLLIGGFIAMIILSPIMFVCVTLSSLLSLLIMPIFSQKIAVKEEEVSAHNEAFLGTLRDIVNGFSVIKCFRAERLIHTMFNTQNTALEKNKLERRDAISDIEIVSTILGTVVLLTIFAVGVMMSMKGLVTIGTITAFIQLSNYIIMPLEFIPIAYGKFIGGKQLIIKLEKSLEIAEEEPQQSVVKAFEDKITFANVSFAYEPDKAILKHIDLVFEKGKSYAIVGSSGSGKTTLINLLLGYRKDYTGEILLDDTELRQIKTDALYNIFSIVQQNVFVFNSSIEDNITMFNEAYRSKLPSVIKQAGLETLVAQRGTDFLCGENGKNLSGGEKQRISIARTILKEMPVILMDEATATLDNITSYTVENAILDLKNQTKIVVTHRLNEKLLKRYDQIILLKNGTVNEIGDFETLMAQKGNFYMLFNASTN